MAQIDLRNATVYVKDGYSVLGAVNQPSTPPANGNTSITVDGFSVAIQNGVTFSIAGSTDLYTVISTTGGATPTAISFTPALRTAAGIPVDNAVVTIGPHILEVFVGDGNLTYSEKRNIEYVRNKRVVQFVRTGDDEPMDVSLDAIWQFIKSATGETVTFDEAVKGIGGASNWVSAGADPCEPYAVTIEIIYVPPCTGVTPEVVQLTEFRWETLDHDLKQATIALKGKCKSLSPTVTRTANPLP